MKSYTDIEQSKKLAEILPIESADMYHFVPADNEGEFVEKVEVIKHKSCYNLFYKITDWDDTPYIPCWSLAALLKVLHCNEKDIVSLSYGGYKDGKYILNWCLDYETENGNYIKTFGDDSIDACVEMIIKLHEKKIYCN